MSTKGVVVCLMAAVALSACKGAGDAPAPITQEAAPAGTQPVAAKPAYTKFLPEDLFVPGEVIARNTVEENGQVRYRQLSQVADSSAAEYFLATEPKILAAGFVKGDDAEGAKVFNRGAERVAIKISYAGVGTKGVREHITWTVPAKPAN